MKIKIYFTIVAMLLSFSSCNKWLSITPKTQAEDKELLNSVYGYNTALGGIYYTLSSTTLYGKEMSYGMMDVLAQYWGVNNPAHSYYPASNYKYDHSNVKTSISSIWKAYYTCIAQCNSILAGLEINRNQIEYSELFEGEALALRAFCHIELLKNFGPVLRTQGDLSKKSIAYRKRFDTNALAFDTCADVLAMAAEDLKKALELMKNDPINVTGRRGDANESLLAYNNILYYRGVRMNYYGVLAMLARVEQIRMNNAEAYKYSMRLITESQEKKVFDLISKADIDNPPLNGRDLNYSKEMVFGVFVSNLWELTNTLFAMGGKTSNLNSTLTIDAQTLYPQIRDHIYERIPDGSAFDNRLRFWFTNDAVPERFEFRKLRKPTEVVNLGAPPFREEISIFRMSEAYYIAAEAKIGVDNTEALELLNTVRRTRNLQDINGPLTNEQLLDFLVREQRKDFIGDGRMFAVYKRLFSSIYVNDKTTIAPYETNFVWPIPDDEYEFSPNEKPKA